MYEYRAYVRKVYDGDTVTVDIDLGFDVVLKAQKIRLVRINAPEVRGKQRLEGLKSRDALRGKIANYCIIYFFQNRKFHLDLSTNSQN